MGDLAVGPDDPSAADVRELLERHLTFARDNSNPEDVHALGPDGLLGDDVLFFSAREEGELLGVGALRDLGSGHVEIKSMHTAEAARGRGVGRLVLDHLLAEARARGSTRVSLETSTRPIFAPARSLYASAGFVPCEPFGEYRANRQSVCMTLQLD